uniref:Uncharacterized protein n=1 Tax=Parascaris univalens TaxID=6257 RepID=A0A915A4H0_PARUN
DLMTRFTEKAASILMELYSWTVTVSRLVCTVSTLRVENGSDEESND